MNSDDHPSDRTQRLIAQLVDGELPAQDSAELNRLVSADATGLEQVVDQLLLDSLLTDELGGESLTALVDMVTEPLADSAAVAGEGRGSLRKPKTLIPERSATLAHRAGWLVAAAIVVLVAFIVGRWDATALADATAVVRAAMVTHAESIERIYVVKVERDEAASPGFDPPHEVRVTTQGDRFWVEMNRGERRWAWGRDTDGAIWLTLGPRRAIVVAQDELGVPLQYISDLYTLNLETLLENFLKHCRLEYGETTGATHLITVTPNRRWKGSWFREATIEVDKETKAVRRLVIERELPQQGPSTVTFTLVDARTPDESKYRPEGHLTEPFRLLTRETRPDKRRELMTNWFGPNAERWIKALETITN